MFFYRPDAFAVTRLSTHSTDHIQTIPTGLMLSFHHVTAAVIDVDRVFNCRPETLCPHHLTSLQ